MSNHFNETANALRKLRGRGNGNRSFINPSTAASKSQDLHHIADLRKQVLDLNGKLCEEAKKRAQCEEELAMLQMEITGKDETACIVKERVRMMIDEVSKGIAEMKDVVDLVGDVPDTPRQTERSDEVMGSPEASNSQRNRRPGTSQRESNTESNS